MKITGKLNKETLSKAFDFLETFLIGSLVFIICVRFNTSVIDEWNVPLFNATRVSQALILCGIIRIIQHRKELKAQDILLILFYAFMVGTTFYNQKTLQWGSYTMMEYTARHFFALYFTMRFNHSEKRMKLIFGIYLIVMGIYCVTALVVYLLDLHILLPNGYIIEQKEPYLDNILLQKNIASIHASIGVIISLACLLHSRKKIIKVLWVIPLLIFSSVILFAKGRGTMAALALTAIIYLFTLPVVKKHKKFFAIAILVLGILSLIIVNFALTRSQDPRSAAFAMEQVASAATFQEKLFLFLDSISSERLTLYRYGITLNKGVHILIGNGCYSFNQIYNEEIGIGQINALENLHNLFLNLYFRTGIIGLALFTTFLALTLKDLYKNRNQNGFVDKIALYIVLSMLILSMLDACVLFMQNLCNYIFWACMGYLASTKSQPTEF